MAKRIRVLFRFYTHLILSQRKKCLAKKSEEEKAAMLENNRLAKAKSRNNESLEVKKERQCINAAAHATKRANETHLEHASRTADMAIRNALNRADDESPSNKVRKLNDSEQHARAWANMTTEKQSDTRSKQALSQAAKRARETSQERKERLEKCRIRMQNYRSRMNAEQRETQRAIDRARHAEYVSPLYHNAIKDMEDIVEADIPQHYCGLMDKQCRACGAWHFEGEQTGGDKDIFTSCCQKGKVKLERLREAPELLRNLLTSKDEAGKNYRENIIHYNASLAFASRQAKLVATPAHGHYSMTIHGQVYHKIGSLYGEPGQAWKYAQLYVLDPEQALHQRMNIAYNLSCDPVIMGELDALLRQVNPYVGLYKRMDELLKERREQAILDNVDFLEPKMWVCHSGQGGRSNEPATTSEMSVVFTGIDGNPPDNVHFCIYPNYGHGLVKMHNCNRDRDPMTMPLLWPYGEQGII